MVPWLVCISTWGLAARTGRAGMAIAKRRATSFFMVAPGKKQKDGGRSGCALEDDLPAAVFLDPVLALLHDVRQVAAPVVLLEGDDHVFLLAGIAEHTDVLGRHLDPILGAVHRALVLDPGGIALAVGGELAGIEIGRAHV